MLKDRITELRRIRAGDLKPNPKNYRVHSDYQRAVVKELVKEVGYVGAALAREDVDGELQLIDGHLRQSLDPDAVIPVLICDLSDEEVDLVLATLDPSTGMAEHDPHLLNNLLAGIDSDSADLRRFLADIRMDEPDEEEEEEEEGEEDKIVPGMELSPHEHYDYIVVLATSAHEWNILCDRLDIEPVERRGRMGICRAIPASKLVTALGVADGTMSVPGVGDDYGSREGA